MICLITIYTIITLSSVVIATSRKCEDILCNVAVQLHGILDTRGLLKAFDD